MVETQLHRVIALARSFQFSVTAHLLTLLSSGARHFCLVLDSSLSLALSFAVVSRVAFLRPALRPARLP